MACDRGLEPGPAILYYIGIVLRRTLPRFSTMGHYEYNRQSIEAGDGTLHVIRDRLHGL